MYTPLFIWWNVKGSRASSVLKKNVRTDGAKPRVKSLIAAANMPVIKYHRFPLGGKTGYQHGSAAPKVSGIEACAPETFNTVYFGFPALNDNIRAQTPKLGSLPVAIFKDILPYMSAALSLQ